MSTTKTCSRCKKKKPLSSFTPRPDRPCGVYSMCKDCKAKSRSVRYFERRKDDPIPQWIVNVKNWAKSRSKKNGVEFDLTHEDVEKALEECKGHCPYCGNEFEFRGTMKDRKSSPSLDRIIPALGYVPNNLTVCCYGCNQTKNEATPSQLLKIAQNVANLAEKRGLTR